MCEGSEGKNEFFLRSFSLNHSVPFPLCSPVWGSLCKYVGRYHALCIFTHHTFFTEQEVLYIQFINIVGPQLISLFHLPGSFLLILYFQHCLSILFWVHLLHTQAIMVTFPAIAIIFHFRYRDICHLEHRMKSFQASSWDGKAPRS